MVPLFSVTIFVGACLLFLAELMFGKMVLPLLGGTPQVWITCMLFFQAALLAGYACAHALVSKLKPARQIPVQLALLALPLLMLPIGIAPGLDPPRGPNPVIWLLMVLAVSVGLPFLVVSTTSPVVQKWFAATGHRSGRDPYFLYVASNLGSAAGLIGYLVVVEPRLTLPQQSAAWSVGYVVLVALFAACGVCAVLPALNGAGGRSAATAEPEDPDPPPSLARRLRWVVLALVPSSLMLGLTSFLTADIAAVPLLWVVPLTLYLLTFVLAFARRPLIPQAALLRLLPILVVIQLVLLARGDLPFPWKPALHLVTFFVAALACHSELAKDRPPHARLTEFYLLVSFGGVMGGVFNGLVAPAVFNSVAEYPIALIAAVVLLPRPGRARAGARTTTAADAAWAVVIGGFAAQMLVMGRATGLDALPHVPALMMGMVALACYAMAERPVRFGLALAAVVLVTSTGLGTRTQIVLQERDFFGVIRVWIDRRDGLIELVHGTTVHGAQILDSSKHGVPVTYYYPKGPIGQVFSEHGGRSPQSVAVVGLGAGTLAAYARPGQVFTFYEIDPMVERIASNPRYFTYLQDARERGADIRVVIGDARLTIHDVPDASQDLIVLDAFSGDSIPVHLLTREAFELYLSKLNERGRLVVHITNTYLDLRPVVGDVAASLGLPCIVRVDQDPTIAEGLRRVPSTWALMARDRADFGALGRDRRWLPQRGQRGGPVWTDSFSNIVGIVKW